MQIEPLDHIGQQYLNHTLIIFCNSLFLNKVYDSDLCMGGIFI